MSARLLLVDGTNIVMRCALGGKLPVAQAVPTAADMIERAAAEFEASFLVVAFDSPAPSWRRALFPAYHAHRTVDTAAFSAAAQAELERRGRYCVTADGFEGDDDVATIAARITHAEVVILSGDSDLLACCRERVRVAQPQNGGGFRLLGEADVVDEYQIPNVRVLADYKALVGEAGDFGRKKDNPLAINGLGAGTAARLVSRYGSLKGIIAAYYEGRDGQDTWTQRVAQRAEDLRLARQLCTLRTDVPLEPILPSRCFIGARQPAVPAGAPA